MFQEACFIQRRVIYFYLNIEYNLSSLVSEGSCTYRCSIVRRASSWRTNETEVDITVRIAYCWPLRCSAHYQVKGVKRRLLSKGYVARFNGASHLEIPAYANAYSQLNPFSIAFLYKRTGSETGVQG